jgi:CBS domain-containing protein
MDRNHIKRFVVTANEDHVTGIVSRPDLVRLFTGRAAS